MEPNTDHNTQEHHVHVNEPSNEKDVEMTEAEKQEFLEKRK